MMRCLVYTDGTTIDAHLDAQTYADAKQVLTDLGGYQTMLDHYMPIFWYLLAGNLRWRRRAFRRTAAWTGISCRWQRPTARKFWRSSNTRTSTARSARCPRRRRSTLCSRPSVRRSLPATEEDAAALLDAWCSGDEAAIIDLLEAEPDEPLTPEEEAAAEEFGRTLVTDRNAVMIRAADEALRAGKNVFYIVGIAHMLGEDGIVEGLRQLGYTVTQVSYTS